MVVDWFRPPFQSHLKTNDLELYNIYNDAWGLVTIGLVLLAVSAYASGASVALKRVIVGSTVVHHALTAVGAYAHYEKDSHYTFAMGIGVWVNVFLTVVGLAAALVAPGSVEARRVNKKLN